MVIDALNSCPWYLIFLIGLAIGFLIGLFSLDRKHHGVIHVTQEEDTDRYFFEFHIEPEEIPRMKTVVFKVKIERDSSQNLQTL